MQSEVMVRTISGVVLGVLVLALTWFGGLAFQILSIVIMALLFFEWFRIVGLKDFGNIVWIIGAVTMAATGLCILAGMASYGVAVVAVGAGLTATVRLASQRDLWPAFGLIYAGFFGVAFAELRNSGGGYGFALLIFIFAIIWSTDIFAFFGGRHFGGPKLAPSISPKKTWSGFVSGLMGGILAGVVAAVMLTQANLIWIVGLAALLSVAGQLGDLFESSLKRRFGVKDSGNIIPGHGGVMDRMDSITFAAFTAYLVGVALPGSAFVSGGIDNGIALQLLGP